MFSCQHMSTTSDRIPMESYGGCGAQAPIPAAWGSCWSSFSFCQVRLWQNAGARRDGRGRRGWQASGGAAAMTSSAPASKYIETVRKKIINTSNIQHWPTKRPPKWPENVHKGLVARAVATKKVALRPPRCPQVSVSPSPPSAPQRQPQVLVQRHHGDGTSCHRWSGLRIFLWDKALTRLDTRHTK